MLSDRLQQVVRKHAWTAMAIKLPDGTCTRPPAADYRLRRIMQVAADLVRKLLAPRRVLDLACLEVYYAIEFALHGCEVVGIDRRDASVAKCNFVKKELGLDRARFFQDDARNLCSKKYRHFYIVICSGLLYLPARDAWSLYGRCMKLARE